MSKAARKFSSGFTLLEILTAIFIFALMVTALMGTYRGILSDVLHLDDRLQKTQMVQICINRISADLQSISVILPPVYKPPALTGPPDPYRIIGGMDEFAGTNFSRLRFVTLTDALLAEGDEAMAEITYYVEAVAGDTFVLKRAQRLFPFETPFVARPSDPVLCTDVRALTFAYYDEEGQWQDRWDSDEEDFGYATPRSLTLTLELNDEAAVPACRLQVALPVWRKAVK